MSNAVKIVLTSAIILLLGCAASKHFAPLPKDMDLTTVPQDTITITAERYHFTPETIHVKSGTLLHITVKSIQGTHGFRLPDFDIDERLEENIPKSIQIYFPEKGEFSFKCSHFCGIGHFGMNGKIIAE